MAFFSTVRQPAAATAASSCLGCIARRSAVLYSPATSTSLLLQQQQQTRGKKTSRREQGVAVRLLEDIPKFGRRDTILRVKRGRMRNFWFPKGMAEYMTAARFAEMGVTNPESVIVEADTQFAREDAEEEDADEDEEEGASQGVQVQSLDPKRAAALLDSMLPPKLVFYRKTIKDAASERVSESRPIFGSVSADDVATSIRDALRADQEAAMIRVEGRDVQFIVAGMHYHTGLGDLDAENMATVDRLKTLGRWEVDITVRGSGPDVPPVRKVVEIAAQDD